jgi:hypothetical protein
MTYRCLELLDLPLSENATDEEGGDTPRPSYLLDIGAGSGLSGEILSEEGHQWVGMDVSGGMLGAFFLPFFLRFFPFSFRSWARSQTLADPERPSDSEGVGAWGQGVYEGTSTCREPGSD